MPVLKLTVCEWQGVSRNNTTIANPTWDQIESAIKALNNSNLNDLYLHTSKAHEDIWLCVGGGNGQYLVSGAAGANKFPTLIDPNKTNTRKFDLTVGGQTGDYPENYILTLEQTLHGVKDFYESGEFSLGINWFYV